MFRCILFLLFLNRFGIFCEKFMFSVVIYGVCVLLCDVIWLW